MATGTPRLASTALAALLTGVAVTQDAAKPRRVRGVPSPAWASYFEAGDIFNCRDGKLTIPITQLNDDFCDCADGSDEPGTSACEMSFFYCANRGHQSKSIPASRVDDGFCDCCDGADEANSGAGCVNDCLQQGESARQAARELADVYEKGLAIAREWAANAAEAKRKWTEELRQVEEEVEQKRHEKATLAEKKKAAEAVERQMQEEEQKKREAADEEERKQREAEEEHAKKESEAAEATAGETGASGATEEAEELRDCPHAADTDAVCAAIYQPVCVRGPLRFSSGSLQFSSRCHAHAAGYSGACDALLVDGECGDLPGGPEAGDEHAEAQLDAAADSYAEDPPPGAHGSNTYDSPEGYAYDGAPDASESHDGGEAYEDVTAHGHPYESEGGADSEYDRGGLDDDGEAAPYDDYIDRDYPEDDYAHPTGEFDDDGSYHRRFDDYDGDGNEGGDDDDDDMDYERLRQMAEGANGGAAGAVVDDGTSAPPRPSALSWWGKVGQDVVWALRSVSHGVRRLLHGSPNGASDGGDGGVVHPEAERLRTEYKAASDALKDAEKRRERLKQLLATDFGPDGRFEALREQCFDFKPGGEHSYELCPFQHAKQKGSDGYSSVDLGKWDGFGESNYTQFFFARGTPCWNGPIRSATISLRCGAENTILSVDEPEICKYSMAFATPAACSEEEARRVRLESMPPTDMGDQLTIGHDEL